MFDSEIADRSGGRRAMYGRGRLHDYVWRTQKRQWVDKVIAMHNRIMAPHGRKVPD